MPPKNPEPTPGQTRRQKPRRMHFTERALEALQNPRAGRLDVWDDELPGFGLRLASSGARVFMVRYRIGRRWRRYRIGDARTLDAKKARAAAKHALARVALGQDPSVERSEDREALSFGKLAAEYLAKHAPKKRTGEGDRAMLENEVLPEWRHLAAKDIKRREVIALLDDIAEGRGNRRTPGRPAPVRANRVLALVRKVYNFGISRDLLEWNPCHLVKPPGVERARDRVLSEAEVGALWRGLEPEPAWFAGPVRFMLLTAQRRGEVLRLRWDDLAEETAPAELRAVDAEPKPPALVWTIPGEVAKNGRVHRVPLSPQAVAIVDALRPLRQRSNPYVFTGRLIGKPFANPEKVMDRARVRAAEAHAKDPAAPLLEHFTAHDLRRTAATYTAALVAGAAARFVVARILNHVDASVTARYDRYSYDREKREALEAWGRRVLELATAGQRKAAEVVPMVRA